MAVDGVVLSFHLDGHLSKGFACLLRPPESSYIALLGLGDGEEACQNKSAEKEGSFHGKDYFTIITSLVPQGK